MKSRSINQLTPGSDSKILKSEPCPKCRAVGKDRTGDHLWTFADGEYCRFHGHNPRSTPKEEVLRVTEGTITNNSTLLQDTPKSTPRVASLQVVPHRGLTGDTLRFYGAKVRVDDKGNPFAIQLPYGDPLLVRAWDQKAFHWEGYTKDAELFGLSKFSSGQSRSITICESAYDAMSVYQLLGSKYPAVGVRSASTARGDCEKHRSYLNSFDRIYLCFDNDVAGEEATRDVAKLFDVSKVYYVKLSKYKDANEYLTANQDDAKAFVSIWFNSRPYLPRGVVNSYEDVEEILARPENAAVLEYKHSTLQNMTGGIRYGEVNLITAQEGVGKTEFLRTIEYQVLKETDDNVAIIHLEEGEKRATQGLIGYELDQPCHLPDAGVSLDDQLAAYKALTKKDGRLHYYAHFGSDDPNTILDIIRYLVATCHCKFVFLDHITMLVTGYEDEDERKKLDYLSTRLAMLTRELGFTLFLVSHVNDDGKTRGSRNISKVADLVLHLDRSVEAATLDERTTTSLMVKKNRYTGKTGPAGYMKFNPKTFKLEEYTVDVAPEIDFKEAA